MEKLPYGPPYPVSPLIRSARYAFLFAGIVYGLVKQSKYSAQEEKWREEEAKRKKIRDKQNAILKARIAREEKETLKLLESGKLFEVPEEARPESETDTELSCGKPKKKTCHCND
ncbi:unnamed protein product [Spodoptera exigua]|uniref:ATP synthase F(0) complex subunit e, mitochondrial n=1 Tax=Spodoptera exigua TaxID=7107 RepID=A0A922MUV7_SPOEX|nr:hypothetical protein HF086_012968 [Spodoptera exigua]CAH0702734.1 unnamed protein product [Spodoptera exigua]